MKEEKGGNQFTFLDFNNSIVEYMIVHTGEGSKGCTLTCWLGRLK